MIRPLPRHRYLEILRAALATQSYRFARQAALEWLSIYPGDLAASLYYGRALLGEKRLPQAIAVFQGIRSADPEFVEAVEALAVADAEAGGMASISAQTHYQALTGRSRSDQQLAPWGGRLWLVRQALEIGNLALASELINHCLHEAENVPLIGVMHLRYLAANPQEALQTRREIALSYHQRWPDCIVCMLWLAQWSMEIGEADYAVALLHQAVSRDIVGQVVRREWGVAHPYLSLWPENLELRLALPIPAEVAAHLGWNRLPSGGLLDNELPDDSGQGDEQDSFDREAVEVDTQDESERALEEALSLMQIPGLEWALAEVDADQLSSTGPTNMQTLASNSSSSEGNRKRNPVEPKVSATVPVLAYRFAAASTCDGKDNGSKPQNGKDSDLSSVVKEFDRLAHKLKLPAVGRLDGRYPVYVIFSVRSRLEAVYSGRIADLLASEMLALAETLGKKRGWNARVFMPDDPHLLTGLGLAPLRTIDPWELKLALVDLDKALSHRGERIGAVLIVGGPEIVPFHCLPNPVDDQDDDVPTDTPYATRDENYFIPEWPVGRLPGGAGDDARVILDTLCRIRSVHEADQEHHNWLQRIAGWLRTKLNRLSISASETTAGGGQAVQSTSLQRASGKRMKAFGYTAAIWKHAATLVFKPIGKPGWLSVSPPFGIDGAVLGTSDGDETHSTGKIPALQGWLGYFNLHGLVDASEWYGQRDALEQTADPDYPIALRPKDVLTSGKNGRNELPQVVFSEACYGLHILDRKPQEAICLSFLQAGSLAVVGSTCMAYGSIAAPLVAADLLGHTFWHFLQEGCTVGEALCQAKIHLASVMSQRQGYLDGEDQKTLISFILYGDPLTQPVAAGRAPKNLRYQNSPLAEVRTVCERSVGTDLSSPLPVEIATSVRRVVARHLPGMSDARLTLVYPRATCAGDGHDCPTHQLDPYTHSAEAQAATVENAEPAKRAKRRSLRQKSKSVAEDACSLVTLSKEVALPNGVHPRVARLTLDERGKLVKLVVSR